MRLCLRKSLLLTRGGTAHVAEAVDFVHSYTTRHTDSNGLLPGQIGYLGGDEVLPTSQALAEEAQRCWITK